MITNNAKGIYLGVDKIPVKQQEEKPVSSGLLNRAKSGSGVSSKIRNQPAYQVAVIRDVIRKERLKRQET